jgi:hypothetical protein
VSATETFRVHGLELAVGEPESVLRERALAAAGVSAAELRGFGSRASAWTRGAPRAIRPRADVGQPACASCARITVPMPARRARLERLRAGRVDRARQSRRLEVERVPSLLRTHARGVLGAGPAGCSRARPRAERRPST